MSDFNEGNQLIAGWVSTDQPPLAADTYYQGMVLEYNATNDNYEAISAGTAAAIYNGPDGDVLAAEGHRDCIMAGEIIESGLVDAAGDPLTVTEDLRAAYRDAGFYLKRS
jgi:hypothetical protein